MPWHWYLQAGHVFFFKFHLVPSHKNVWKYRNTVFSNTPDRKIIGNPWKLFKGSTSIGYQSLFHSRLAVCCEGGGGHYQYLHEQFPCLPLSCPAFLHYDHFHYSNYSTNIFGTTFKICNISLSHLFFMYALRYTNQIFSLSTKLQHVTKLPMPECERERVQWSVCR
jgi:hypothetical protein